MRWYINSLCAPRHAPLPAARIGIPVAVSVALLLQPAASGGEIKFVGMITGYGHGLAAAGVAPLPAPYTGRFNWDPSRDVASFLISAPSLDASLLSNPRTPSGQPFLFRDSYFLGNSRQDHVTESPSGLSAQLSSGGINIGVGLIESFGLDASYRDGTGDWSYTQQCPACDFVGLYGVSGTITSIVGVVPEPSAGSVATVAVATGLLSRRRSTYQRAVSKRDHASC